MGSPLILFLKNPRIGNRLIWKRFQLPHRNFFSCSPIPEQKIKMVGYAKFQSQLHWLGDRLARHFILDLFCEMTLFLRIFLLEIDIPAPTHLSSPGLMQLHHPPRAASDANTALWALVLFSAVWCRDPGVSEGQLFMQTSKRLVETTRNPTAGTYLDHRISLATKRTTLPTYWVDDLAQIFSL